MTDDGGKTRTSWWQTLPGILTAAAATITAMTGLLVALDQVGLLGGPRPAQPENAAPKPSLSAAAPAPPSARPEISARETTPSAPASIQATAPTPSSRPAASVNLLSPDNGGHLLLAPNEEWAVTIDGREDQYREVKVGEEAVYAFRDEQPATFDSFGMLIPKSGRNPKEFELFVADQSPNGPFRSIGTFQPQNVRMMQTGGWQDFAFPPVTAKYLKVGLRSNYEDVVWLDLYEFRLRGQPN